MSSKLVNTVIVISMLSNLVASLGAITLLVQSNASRETASARASIERKELRKQNDFIICVLQVQPAERSDDVVKQCREDTIGVR